MLNNAIRKEAGFLRFLNSKTNTPTSSSSALSSDGPSETGTKEKHNTIIISFYFNNHFTRNLGK